MRRFPAYLLTLFYAGLSFLGHAGLHAVDGTGHCNHHAHEHATSDDSAALAHGHSHCCQHAGHVTSPSTDEKPESAPVPHREAPTPHDHDHCLICQWHAQGKTSLEVPTATPLDVPCLDSLSVEVTLKQENEALTARSRGPPLCG